MTIQEHTAINRDKEIVQELARQVLDLSSLEINHKRKDRLRAVNDLHTGLRPGVWLNEIPWHEMDIDGNRIKTLYHHVSLEILPAEQDAPEILFHLPGKGIRTVQNQFTVDVHLVPGDFIQPYAGLTWW